MPLGIIYNTTVTDIGDACQNNGCYSFGPYTEQFIGIITVLPVNSTVYNGTNSIEICKY